MVVLMGSTHLLAQSITDVDPAPGIYDSITATGTNTVVIGDGVEVTSSKAEDASTIILQGGDSLLNYANDTATFRQEGGIAGNNYSFQSGTFIQSGGSSGANFAQGTGIFLQTGGSTDRNALSGTGFLHQSGGTAGRTDAELGNSTLFLSGGQSGRVTAGQGTNISIWASDFSDSDLAPDATGQATYNLDDLSAFTSDLSNFIDLTFNVTWQDGLTSSFFMSLNRGTKFESQTWTGTLSLYDTDTFAVGSTSPLTPVPEPSVYGLISLTIVGAYVIWKRRSPNKKR